MFVCGLESLTKSHFCKMWDECMLTSPTTVYVSCCLTACVLETCTVALGCSFFLLVLGSVSLLLCRDHDFRLCQLVSVFVISES